jgi:probable F420-dependent oxidoreductase
LLLYQSAESGAEGFFMKIGLFGINFGVAADVEVMIHIAKAAESSGLDSVWTGEHVVLPDPRVAPSPSDPQTPFLDPCVALSYIAAHTGRLLLGTGVIILPQRNPLVLAKELASLDVVSKGRLIFGLGAGYLEPEFRALGAPFEERGAVTDESIEVLKALWVMKNPAYKGKFYSFDNIDAQPRPVQQPHPPIVIGGMSRKAARRAARYGNGWYGFRTDIEATVRSMQWIKEYVANGERPSELGEIEISITPPKRLTPDLIDEYERIGVHRLIPAFNATSLDDALRFIDGIGEIARQRASW